MSTVMLASLSLLVSVACIAYAAWRFSQLALEATRQEQEFLLDVRYGPHRCPMHGVRFHSGERCSSCAVAEDALRDIEAIHASDTLEDLYAHLRETGQPSLFRI